MTNKTPGTYPHRLSTILAIALLVTQAKPCTLAIVSAKASAAGAALMWKNRDAPNVNNMLRYFEGPKFGFVAVVNAEDSEGGSVWGGLNTAGFAIMNSLSGDLAAGGASGQGNGALMKLALGECASVGDFEKLLIREKGMFALAANFGVIDAEGNACFFETGKDSFQKFDTADSRVAPFGYFVRTNFAFTAPDLLKGGGFIRFERISHIMESGYGNGRIDARFILQEAARDLVNEKLHSHPLAERLPEERTSPLYVNTNHTINRNSSVSVLLFQAAPRKDLAHLATMWVILGQPVAGIAVPVWPAAGKVPSVTSGSKTAPLNDISRAIVSFLYPDRRGQMTQYLDVTRLRSYGGEGVLAKILRIEDLALDETAARLAAWEKARPSAEEVAGFQEKIATGVANSMKREFADLLIR